MQRVSYNWISYLLKSDTMDMNEYHLNIFQRSIFSTAYTERKIQAYIN